MIKQKLSGHNRLKSAMVLRDALAAELKIPLHGCLKFLLNVEKELGCGRALHEGRYLEAISSLCNEDSGLLSQLDAQVRVACIKARLAPRYAQYMALLLFAAWLNAKRFDQAGFIERLNLYLSEHPSRIENLPAFTEADMQYAAFWMATAAGSLIIQMFGRVVRFAGKNRDGKRLEKPPPNIKPLQTSYIYGLKSAYLETFLNGLYANGVPDVRSIECPTFINLPKPTQLKSIKAISPLQSEFSVTACGSAWLAGVNKVRMSCAATVTTAGMNANGVQTTKGVAGEDITGLFKQLLPFIDFDDIYREMVEMKRQMRWWNFAFDKSAILAALTSNRYEIFCLSSAMRIQQESDLNRINRMAATLVRQLFEAAYRKQESKKSSYNRLGIEQERSLPENYRKESAW